MIVNESYRSRRPPASETRILAFLIPQSPILSVLHGFIQYSFCHKVKKCHTTCLVKPIAQHLTRTILVVLKAIVSPAAIIAVFNTCSMQTLFAGFFKVSPFAHFVSDRLSSLVNITSTAGNSRMTILYFKLCNACMSFILKLSSWSLFTWWVVNLESARKLLQEGLTNNKIRNMAERCGNLQDLTVCRLNWSSGKMSSNDSMKWWWWVLGIDLSCFGNG